ncbi:MAG TPA: cytochrome c-type biogenesis protein CcmH [Candidatus Methylomirabilis sp.]|nr:cytochrome c-type biogenesis protein CcmH [Candidatus Methylomirabilis sp.]
MIRIVAMMWALCALCAAAAVAAPVDEETVRQIATQLRCVVCQSLSVADSPSETASQMRGVIRERLAAGQTPEQITAYFVDKYGLWILLAPPRQGFSLLVWVIPYAALLGGLVLVGLAVRRWSRRSQATPVEAKPVDEATRQRIRQELAELDRE